MTLSACDGCIHRDPVDGECNVFGQKVAGHVATCTARSPAFLYGSPPGAEALALARKVASTSAPSPELEVIHCAGGCGEVVEEEGERCTLCEEIAKDEAAGDDEYHRTREDES